MALPPSVVDARRDEFHCSTGMSGPPIKPAIRRRAACSNSNSRLPTRTYRHTVIFTVLIAGCLSIRRCRRSVVESAAQDVTVDESFDLLRDPYPLFAQRRGGPGVFKGSVMGWSKTPASMMPGQLY